MRLLAGFSLCALIACASASCGVLAGIDGYTGELGEILDGAIARGPDSSPVTEDAAEDSTEATEDAGGDTSSADEDAADAAETATPIVDAETPPDDSALTAEAKPACGPSSCPSGCCNSDGDCAGSEQSTGCGTGGAACEDCTKSGQVCTNSMCVAPKPDASAPPPSCTSSSCKNSCGGLQIACCNSSTHACGCEYYWPSTCQ